MKRREFLQTSAAAGAAAYGLSKVQAVHAAENNTLKIGAINVATK